MYTAEDLREELSYHVKVDADIAGKIDYSRYVMICENYIRANYFGGKNRRLITLDKPVTSIGFYLSAKLKRDCIVFTSLINISIRRHMCKIIISVDVFKLWIYMLDKNILVKFTSFNIITSIIFPNTYMSRSSGCLSLTSL